MRTGAGAPLRRGFRLRFHPGGLHLLRLNTGSLLVAKVAKANGTNNADACPPGSGQCTRHAPGQCPGHVEAIVPAVVPDSNPNRTDEKEGDRSNPASPSHVVRRVCITFPDLRSGPRRSRDVVYRALVLHGPLAAAIGQNPFREHHEETSAEFNLVDVEVEMHIVGDGSKPRRECELFPSSDDMGGQLDIEPCADRGIFEGNRLAKGEGGGQYPRFRDPVRHLEADDLRTNTTARL
mmetsp:Transcript_42494/g.123521  ORF Transcript_42494/g.123521 Transcript_42494/m.123521 type:complete len:236 (+) Transcript_42494:363-1070(+)